MAKKAKKSSIKGFGNSSDSKSKKQSNKKNIIPFEGSFGGSKPSSPSESDDTGLSSSVATITEILSEGLIQGFPTPNFKRHIFLDGTPIENPNGTQNFKGAKVRFRRGSQYQDILPGNDAVENETSLNLEVVKNIPVTRTIINSELDAIRVRIGVVLQKSENDGDIVGDSVTFRVLTKQGNEPFVLRRERTIRGKYSSLTEFEMQFPVNNLGGTRDNFQIRVVKVSDDSTSIKLQRTLRFQAYAEITNAKLSYPFTAIIQSEFDAKQFNSVPTRSFDLGGVLFRIPTKANVRSDGSLSFDRYPGVWDGNFYEPEIAINDPVWQLYGILTNDRWGIASYINQSRIDKWSLYNASVYNNERVADGLGGVESRFQCSTVIQTKEKVYDVINALCSSCNIKPYWAEGTLKFWQDRPGEVAQQFTQADVENGDFVYTTTAIRSRFTVCNVTYNDPTNGYEQRVETVEDKEAILRYGIRETDIVAYGCFSRGQAIRVGKWALFSSQNDTLSVSFTARAYAAYIRPGDIIQIADPKISNIRYGGLITNNAVSSASEVWLDSPISTTSIGNLSVILDNGRVETRTAFVPFANTPVVVVSPPFSSAPNAESSWIYSSPTVKPQLFRVLIVKPNDNDVTKVDITAIKHTPGKYDFVESGIELPTEPIRNVEPIVTTPPFGLVGSVSTLDNGTIVLGASWMQPLAGTNTTYPDPFVTSFIVEFKRGLAGVYQGSKTVSENSTTFTLPGTGEYYFRVASVSVSGKSSVWVESAAIPAS